MDACYMCDNARVNPELSSDGDLSYISLGTFCASRRMFIRSGDDRPTEIVVEELSEGGWYTIGSYRPRYCPNWGRELVENR